MLKRDFSNESIFNLMVRFSRAASGRICGVLLKTLGTFKRKPKNLYFGSYPRLINSKSISLGDGVKFGLCARIECYSINNLETGNITIGDHSNFGDYVHIGCVSNITIGKYVLGGSNILITDHSHGKPKHDMIERTNTPPVQREISSKGVITVGNNVWLSDGVIILAGADIGEGSIIAANAIVKGIVPPFTIFGN